VLHANPRSGNEGLGRRMKSRMNDAKLKIPAMPFKSFVVLALLAVYLILIIPVTIYYANNFSTFVHSRAGEIIDYAGFLLLTAIVFHAVASLVAKIIEWRIILLSTIVNFILSFIFGFSILIASQLTGRGKEIIFIYGSCFLFIFSAMIFLMAYRLSEN
jgi:hypothetical protein